MPRIKIKAGAHGAAPTQENFTQAEEDDEDAHEATLPTADDEAAAVERSWRDRELLDTDKWAGSDRTMSANMTTYRQELRDMPTLTGFPNTHTRPTRPAGE